MLDFSGCTRICRANTLRWLTRERYEKAMKSFVKKTLIFIAVMTVVAGAAWVGRKT